MTQLLRFVTRTQLVRFRPFVHGLRPSLTTLIPPPLTVTLPQFSTKTPATHLRDRSPANDAQPTGFTPPTVGGEEFIHISEADTVAPAPAASPAPETSVGLDRHPVALPEELSRNVIHLSCESTAEGGVCDVYLVGTTYEAKESSKEVRAIVDFLKPEVVFLELCSTRIEMLTDQEKKAKESMRHVRAIVDFLKPEAVFLEVLTYQKKKFKSSGGFEKFTNFVVAYEEAIKYGGRVILGDRPIEITVMRFLNIPFWRKKILCYASFFRTLFSASSDERKMWFETDGGGTLFIQKMSKEFPTLLGALFHERDQYMSSTLLKVASESRSVVAVVGKWHLQGIKRNWKQPVVLEDLMTVPSISYGYWAEVIMTSPTILMAIAGVYIISRLYH